MDLFTTIAPETKLHPVYSMLKDEVYKPEQDVVRSWAEGFVDRDGKFPYEFQTTFESSLWELYLYAFLKERGAEVDFSHNAPDFVVNGDQAFCIEATIAAPSIEGTSPIGLGMPPLSLLQDLNEFNRKAALRICNSLSNKINKYRSSYSNLSHVKDKPFIVAIASYDQPFSYMESNRAIMAALYGIYFDEEATIASGSDRIIARHVEEVEKKEDVSVSLGYFFNEEHSEISAVIYSCLVTWGKIRALADNNEALSIYTSYHLNTKSIVPEVRVAEKKDYVEYLADGLYIFHNPFATYRLSPQCLGHERIRQIVPETDGSMKVISPDDFLLTRQLNSLRTRTE